MVRRLRYLWCLSPDLSRRWSKRTAVREQDPRVRVKNFDDSAGRRYQERTEPFWREVRAAWDEVIARRDQVVLRAAPDQAQLFVPLFEYAEKLADGGPFDHAAARAFARSAVRGYLAEETATRDATSAVN